MEIINTIIDFFINLTTNNIIDIAIGLAIIIFFKIISPALAYIIIKMFNIKKKKEKIKSNGFYKPLKIFFVLLGIYIALLILNLPKDIFNAITKIFRICTIILIAKGLANLFDYSSDTFETLKSKLHFNTSNTTINFISRAIKSLIYIIAGFVIISEFGYDLNGLAAGLGIGSVVIALAAQDIAKSVLSGLSILYDRPFEINDTIEVDGIIGTVEIITFRTTRIRNVDNQIVILPNSSLTSANIINYNKIEKRKYKITLTLELNTPLDKVSALSNQLKDFLNSKERIIKDSIKVYFDTISADGIDLIVFFYTDITDYTDYINFKEEINYTLLHLIEQEHVELAYPSHSVYLKQG